MTGDCAFWEPPGAAQAPQTAGIRIAKAARNSIAEVYIRVRGSSKFELKAAHNLPITSVVPFLLF
jgi:hypothetical protein